MSALPETRSGPMEMIRVGSFSSGRGPRLVAAVTGQASYQVDETFRGRFLGLDPTSDRFFASGPEGRPHFDLQAYVVARLMAAGIASVEALGLDTYADADRFYSYRRSTHRGEADYGRQLSCVAVPNS